MSESTDPSPKRTPDLRDAFAAIGLGLLAYGCWLAWKPLGFIVPGTLLFGLTVIGVRR